MRECRYCTETHGTLLLCEAEWLPVPGYEGLYEVSSHGAVWSVPRRGRKGLMLAQSDRGRGYLSVSLSRDGVGTTWSVHVLVMTTFVGRCPDGEETRHLDGDPGNNTWPANLVYGTPPENGHDKVRHGTAARGERNGRHKLTAVDVGAIHLRRGAGESTEDLSHQFGISRVMVRRILRGAAWRDEFPGERLVAEMTEMAIRRAREERAALR